MKQIDLCKHLAKFNEKRLRQNKKRASWKMGKVLDSLKYANLTFDTDTIE